MKNTLIAGLAVVLMLVVLPGSSARSSTAVLSPPSGRPPVGPLERYEPKVYDVTFDVTLATQFPHHPDEVLNRSRIQLQSTPIVMPLVFRGTFSEVDPDSVHGGLFLGGRQNGTALRTVEGLPFNSHLAEMTVGRFDGYTLRWNVAFRMQAFSSRINDSAAAEIAWPREWPKDAQDGLKPQLFIESDAPIFAKTLQHLTKGQLRFVPPYLAAKDIVRYCVNEVQISGDGLAIRDGGFLHGLEVQGARRTAESGRGGPHDLVCVCVAMLRAAGIPARPLIGIDKTEGRKTLVSWAEFYLPDTGWVPFDPNQMRKKGVRSLDVHRPWPEFGTMKDLNGRALLAYHFMPPREVESPQFPALWGWNPRPASNRHIEQRISLLMISRGRGTPDPE